MLGARSWAQSKDNGASLFVERTAMKNIIILGSTGSIGTQTLDVIRQYSDKLGVLGLCCDKNIDLLYDQIQEFSPKYIAVKDEQKARELSRKLGREVWSGDEGILRLASIECDVVLNSLVGISGLEPTINAINAGNDIALANKETLVAGGDIVMPLARSKNVKILPVDSEHSAIWQCLDFDKSKKISSILLTASGGAFRDFTKEQLVGAKSQDALNAYRLSDKKYTVRFEGDDQLVELNDGITELTGENQMLRKRVANLRAKIASASEPKDNGASGAGETDRTTDPATGQAKDNQ